jgi:hypothetical protein
MEGIPCCGLAAFRFFSVARRAGLGVLRVLVVALRAVDLLVLHVHGVREDDRGHFGPLQLDGNGLLRVLGCLCGGGETEEKEEAAKQQIQTPCGLHGRHLRVDSLVANRKYFTARLISQGGLRRQQKKVRYLKQAFLWCAATFSGPVSS